MSRKNQIPKTRVHIWLDSNVNDRLHLYFGTNPGYSAAINVFLRKALQQYEERIQATVAAPIAPADEAFAELSDNV